MQAVLEFLKPEISKLLIVIFFLTLFVIISNILVYYNLYASSIVEFRDNRNLQYQIKGQEMLRILASANPSESGNE